MALTICWELRLEPRIGVYRRAMVNLLIAQLLQFGQLKYAEECLDLLDIVRQDNNGEVSDNIKNVIAIAEGLIEEFEVKQQQTATTPKARAALPDPSAGLLSGPPSSPPVTVQQGTANKAKGDKDGRIVYVYETDNNDKDDVVADRNNTVQIQGMLGDSRYKHRVKKASAMPSRKVPPQCHRTD